MKPTDKPVRIPGASQSISDNNLYNGKSQVNSSLVIRDIYEKYELTAYPHCIEFSPISPKKNGTHFITNTRGKISTFSPKARFRLFTTLAKVKEKFNIQPIFVTLTYHHGHHKKTKCTKPQLHHFLVSLRQYDPKVSFIWRFEFQKRGAPHYHLIIFPAKPPGHSTEKTYSQRISQIWHNIADPDSRAHKQYGCKIVTIDSYRKACGYLSKYIAKVDNQNNDNYIGKHWGNSHNMPFDIKEHSEYYENGAKAIIEKLRKWLVKNGKEKYASPEFFNHMRDQVVFIDYEEFENVIHNRDQVEKWEAET